MSSLTLAKLAWCAGWFMIAVVISGESSLRARPAFRLKLDSRDNCLDLNYIVFHSYSLLAGRFTNSMVARKQAATPTWRSPTSVLVRLLVELSRLGAGGEGGPL